MLSAGKYTNKGKSVCEVYMIVTPIKHLHTPQHAPTDSWQPIAHSCRMQGRPQ